MDIFLCLTFVFNLKIISIVYNIILNHQVLTKPRLITRLILLNIIQEIETLPTASCIALYWYDNISTVIEKTQILSFFNDSNIQ